MIGFEKDQLGVTGLPSLALPQNVAEPFVWGQGGQRLLPEDIARKRQMAQALMQSGMDYSPAGSWTQGLARAAQGILGGFEERSANKASAANAQANSATIASLLAPGMSDNNKLLSASVDPYASDDVKSVARMLYQRNNPAAKAPNENQQMLIDAGYVPGSPEWIEANKKFVDYKTDPVITTSLPGDRFYTGPRSGLSLALGGGGPPSGAQPPATLPPDFDFGTQPPAGNLGVPAGATSPGGSTPTFLSKKDQAPMLRTLGGQEGLRRWAAKHNVRLEN